VTSWLHDLLRQTPYDSDPPSAGPRWKHHDGSAQFLAPYHGLTPLEVLDLHCALGIASRSPENHGAVARARAALNRVGIFDECTPAARAAAISCAVCGPERTP